MDLQDMMMAQQAEMEKELKKMQAVFDSVRGACFKKCIERFGDSDFTIGETACVDRCVTKYLKVQEKVEKRLQPVSPPINPLLNQ